MPRRLAVLLAAATAAATLAAPAAHAESLDYVALGDSYSAASGVLPPDPAASPLCLRSSRNYPHVLAVEIGAHLTDVTCGAAETKHFTTAQYPGVPPQLDAVGADTDLITMTIGGNDSGVFISAILACGSAGILTLGQGSPCRDIHGSSFEDTVRTKTYPALVTALRAVRDKAPDAEVAILGYPWILPATGGCFDRMPVAAGDVPYLRSLQATLNDAVERAAGETGATYVDLSAASEGHDACQAPGVRWIEPVLQGTNPVVVHPNARGEAAMAARTLAVLGLR
ncbi:MULTISPECIES: SGNH/GDSL hydrolase family protein [Amycolatopsis]|uniref:SGNH/GDSL hydrolase family protein n=1 Tax=Amycolatopsis TaxID=1813 RepID=UPI000B8AFD9C|nr:MULTISPECIES: SGNH/GDSL hydrolase family protein [Amycolatopsis]OXM75254.1 lipase [Amycolatopsis sp. KNN50.9b]